MLLRTAAPGGVQLARAPIAVLRLYSSVLRDMDADGVFADCSEPPVVPASAHHDAEAVATALRWALGLCTLLAADVHTCVRVLKCERRHPPDSPPLRGNARDVGGMLQTCARAAGSRTFS